jgi:hypothetical protein
VINETDTYEVTANSTSEGILSFYDNDWDPEMNISVYDNDKSGWVKYNVTDFNLTNYGKTVEYHEYIEIKYTILFFRPLGVFKFTNENQATAANDPGDEGVQFWLTAKIDGEWVNYIQADSSQTITYMPTF